MREPPFEIGAVHLTEIEVAVTPVTSALSGLDGNSVIMTDRSNSHGSPIPNSFSAKTRKHQFDPGSRLATV